MKTLIIAGLLIAAALAGAAAAAWADLPTCSIGVTVGHYTANVYGWCLWP